MRIRFIPTSIHVALDYSASAVNLIFSEIVPAGGHPAGGACPPRHRRSRVGLQPDHRLRARRVEGAANPAHLAFDAAKGVFMASSPWLFGFARNGTRYWLPHLLMGIADVLAAVTSKTG